MRISIVKSKIAHRELVELASCGFGDMVKGVADVKRKIMALGGELHADAESLLITDGSISSDLWGFNIYPMKSKEERIEFTSLINIKPSLGNRSMEVKDEKVQKQILSIIEDLVELT